MQIFDPGATWAPGDPLTEEQWGRELFDIVKLFNRGIITSGELSRLVLEVAEAVGKKSARTPRSVRNEAAQARADAEYERYKAAGRAVSDAYRGKALYRLA
jgi:hypothetical protein